MKANPRKRKSQRGAALILFATVLVLGVAWFTVGALDKAAPATAEREIRSALALQAAKQALLSYVAQYAARSQPVTDPINWVPGRLPCPESLGSIGGANEGNASSSCSNAVASIGRLPWRTLGVDQPRDGNGEPLWYVLSPGFRNPAPTFPTPINFGTAGQLPFDGAANAAVALIIAPGRALNTMSDPATPSPGCSKVNQQSNRYASPLNPTKFFECGNASGNYANLGSSQWSNDRVITITAAEWADAISGPIADRLQRQVAPALTGWDQAEFAARGKSWGTTHGLRYLPLASTFSDPATNDYCGDAGVREGLIPMASKASVACMTNWSASASLVLGLTDLGCTDLGSYLRCTFNSLGTPPFSARITATAPRVAASFRSTISASDITLSDGGNASLSMSLSSATGNATATVDVTWPAGIPAVVEVRIPHLSDAAFISDPTNASYQAMNWFRNNDWNRYTYYAVAPSATANPVACAAAGDPGCVAARGLPASTGNYWDKRLVLILVGPALPGQARACTDTLDANGLPSPNGIPDCQEIVNYLEEENRSAGDRTFRADLRVANPAAATPPYPPFNDRLAVCPYQLPTTSGSTLICN